MNYNQILIIIFALLFGSLQHKTAQGQGMEDEVFLQFRHAGVVNSYLSTIYFNDQFYISIGDLFSSLQIDHTIESGNNIVQGIYPPKRQFSIQFQEQIARIGNRRVNFTADDYVLTDFGYYIRIEILYELFGILSFRSLWLCNPPGLKDRILYSDDPYVMGILKL